jgi:hypothetical protein
MSYSKHRLKEVVAFQKRILERIETDLGEFGPSPRLKYIQEFTEEFSTFQSPSSIDEIVAAASEAHVVWLGDYHALSRSREFAADFLKRLVLQKKNQVVLAVEVVFARHQKLLDRWLAGKLTESEFLERIRYSDEWGCDWPSYKKLFDVARELRVPIYAVDCHPRRDLRCIRRRDQGVARRVSKLVQEDPSRTVLVLFGESHLATTHLPSRVRSVLAKKDVDCKDLVVLQNLDEIYWQLQQGGLAGVTAVQIQPKQYCVFNVTPLEKYEWFRQYLNECTGDEEATGDWTRFVQTLIDGLFDFLDIQNRQRLVDYMPKVYSEISSEQLPEFLSRQNMPAERIRSVIDNLQDRGTSYIPELNSIFIDHFNLHSTAEETARFIHRACRGGLNHGAAGLGGDEFFVSVIERSLGYFCSKLLDASRDGIEALSDRVMNHLGYNDDFARSAPYFLDPGKEPSAAHFEKLATIVEQHASRHEVVGMLAQMLGYGLGRKLHRAYLENRISRKEIQVLFHDPLASPPDALVRYVELNHRLA